MLGVRTTGVWPRCHASQPHLAHQALYPLAIDGVTRHFEEDNHPAAAIERVPRVFLINQVTEQQVAFIGWFWVLPHIVRVIVHTPPLF